MIELGEDKVESRTVKIPKKQFSLVTEISKPIKSPTNSINDNKIKDNNNEDDISKAQKPEYIITEHNINNLYYLSIPN
nr:5597_t:CDS:2 [Entrophospora candida]